MEMIDLRAIAAGYDTSLVEAVGGEVCLTEGAVMQGMSVKFSATAKSAKAHMKEAKKLSKNNPEGAKKEYNLAISDLKELMKEAEKIEDDHLVMVAVDAFIKSFIPMMAGVLITNLTGSQIPWLISIIGGYICGMSKSLDFSAAVEKKLTGANKQGKGGSVDPSVWWKAGETRGAVMTKFDRMITACEKAKEKL